jgi:sodium transport system permease protein
MNLGRILRLCRKELLETLRDRRTIITLILMPLLVYPLLSMTLNRFLLSSGGSVESPAFRLGVATDREAELLGSILNSDQSQPPQPILEASGGQIAKFNLFTTTTYQDDDGKFWPGKGVEPLMALEQNRIDLAVKIETQSDKPQKNQITITHRTGDEFGENARRVLVERLQWYRLSAAESKVVGGYESPFLVKLEQWGKAATSSVLSSIIPLVLVLMTITGAVYPAIDLTAGERERGTMEALMASPISPVAVLFAKYVAVIVVAMLTAMANLISMFATLWVSGLLPMLTGSDQFPWTEVGLIFGLLLLFSAFFSAVLLSLTSFARSFKEAQAYLIPVMLLSLTPGMLSLVPGVTLSGALAIAPLINIVLLAREVLGGNVQAGPAGAAIISTLFYSAAALSIAAKLFGADAVTRSSDSSIASLFRRPKMPSLVPTPQTAALVMALLVSIYFVVSNTLMAHLGGVKQSLLTTSDQLTDAQTVILQTRSMILSAVALVLVFGLIPLSASVLTCCRLKTTYRWNRFSLAMGAGAVVIGLSAWVLAHEAFVIADQLGIGGLDDEKVASMKSILEAWTRVPPWIMLLCLAATPAIIEELCFRGFLFSALSRVLSPGKVIAVTAIVFGVFHVITGNALLVERFVPSTLLGFILGWIAYRTGSVLPGMALHFAHNGLLNLVGHYHKQISWFHSDFDNQTHLPATWILGSAAIVTIGIGLVVWSTQRQQADSPKSRLEAPTV